MAMLILLALVAAAPPLASARLSEPDLGHQLTVGGASSGANPQIDGWHTAEKKRIEDECDGLMRKLWADKRQKLQDLVDAARRRVEEERRKLAEAKARAQAELDALNRAKAQLQNINKVDTQPTKDAIVAQEAKIAELERLIAEKKACIEELRQAEADLAEALRKLAEAQRKVKAAEADASQQRGVISREQADIPPAQADVDSAEDDLARAKARHEAATRKVNTARGDLAEHDNEGMSNPAPAPAPAPESPAPAPERKGSSESQKSGARMLAVGPVAATLLLGAMLL